MTKPEPNAARLALFACALVCTCLPSVAASEHVPEPEGFWMGPINSPVPATIRGGEVVHAHELAQMIETDDPLVIDVSNMPKRPEGMPADAPWLPLPHESIPGALWIPDVGNGTLDASMNEFFAAQLAEETDKDFDRPIVIYCHERCWLSWNAAKRAIGYGYRNVHWFPEGIEGWRAGGFNSETVRPRLPPEV
jgi:PQQ-dependent catabolism-associated CXXCW motif protein